MKPYVVVVVGLGACAGGGGDPSAPGGQSLGTVYTADRVNTQCRPDNLLAGGGFERVLPGLELCGNATLQSDVVAQGSRAVRLRTGGEPCTPDVLFVAGKAAQALIPLPDLDFVGQDYTIRFKLRVVESSPNLLFRVNLTHLSDPEAIFGDILLRRHEGPFAIDGFLQYELVWRTEGLGERLDPDLPVYLEVELENTPEVDDIVIDDIEVVPSGYYPCGSVMDDAYTAQANDLRLVAVDGATSELVVFRGDGQDARSYDVGLGEDYRFAPGFWDEDHIVFPVLTFNTGSNGSEVVPASGTDLIRFDLQTGEQQIVFQTIGSPGSYEAYSYSNVDALDIEVRQSVFDLDRGVGLLTVCGRNRQVFGVTSDDLCLLTTVDATTFDEIEADTRGFFPSPSRATGRLAYYDRSSVWLGGYSASGVDPGAAIYTSWGIGTLATAASLSPDGATVVFADAISVEVRSGGEIVWLPSLFAYDVETGRTRMLHPLGFGRFANGFAWTPDSAYLVYSVLTFDDGLQTWWLDVRSGTTGPITTDVSTYAVRGL